MQFPGGIPYYFDAAKGNFFAFALVAHGGDFNDHSADDSQKGDPENFSQRRSRHCKK